MKLKSNAPESPIALAEPYLGGNEAEYLNECIRSNFVSSVGPFVVRFERMIADRSGCSAPAVSTASGTSGLHLALKSLGVQPGDLVIIPDFTFIASANAIAHCGAVPWLIDISEESWTIDPDILEEELSKNTTFDGDRLIHGKTGRRVAAIMPVYTLGLPADMDRIKAISTRFNLPIVADAAAAIGATYKGQPLGPFADLSVYSFNGNKTITTGGGGAVIGNDKSLIDLARHLCTTARIGPDYHHDLIGFNYRMTNLQAAVGCAQLEQLDGFLDRKRTIARKYHDEFGGITGIGFFPAPPWAESSCWLSGITLPKPLVDEVRIGLNKRGIQVKPFWKPIHLQPPYRNAPRGDLRKSTEIWEQVLPLPCSTNLSENDQERVIESLSSILEPQLRG